MSMLPLEVKSTISSLLVCAVLPIEIISLPIITNSLRRSIAVEKSPTKSRTAKLFSLFIKTLVALSNLKSLSLAATMSLKFKVTMPILSV